MKAFVCTGVYAFTIFLCTSMFILFVIPAYLWCCLDSAWRQACSFVRVTVINSAIISGGASEEDLDIEEESDSAL